MDFIGGGNNGSTFDCITTSREAQFDAPVQPERKRPEQPHLGYFDGDPTKSAENPFVLVVHYDFATCVNMRREGNDADVANLKDVFYTGRGCAFKELCSPSKTTLLNLLGSDQEMAEFTGLSDGVVPSVFILVILSHGDRDGKIFTEELVDPNANNSDRRLRNTDFVSFTTVEVLDRLKELKSLKDSLKIVFFGPCRGENVDFSSSPVENSAQFDHRNACRIYSQPNQENFVIFFSTVESSMAKRDANSGTWMVTCLHNVLEKSQKDVPLEVLLTKMQHAIHNRTHYLGNGQTPETKFFTSKNFTFYNVMLYNFIRSLHITPPSGSHDGIGNTDRLQSEERLNFYPWTDKNETPLSRGPALIFYKNSQEKVAEMETALNGLSFETSIMPMHDSATIIANVNQGVCDSGCILVCFLSRISKRQNDIFEELCVDVGAADSEPIPIQDLISLFVGPSCNKWIGKPKIFFFLDLCQRFDAELTNKDTNPFDFSNVGTNCSGLFTYVGFGQDAAIKLLAELNDNRLKSGRSLQEAVGDILRSCNNKSDILPQVTSTLHYLLDFPDLENTYVPPTVQEEGVDAPALPFNDFRNSLLESEDDATSEEGNSHFDGGLGCPVSKRPRLNRLQSRVWLLSTPPAMGKTHLTKQMAKWVRSNFPGYIVYEMRLLQKTDYLSETEWEDISVLGFLLGDNPSPKDIELLQRKLDDKQVIIFLDGFEKICPKYKSPVLILLEKLLSLQIPLWVTTRPEEELVLNNKLKSPRFSLLRINILGKAAIMQVLMLKLKKDDQLCNYILDTFQSVDAEDFLQIPGHLAFLAELYKKENYKACDLFQMVEHVVDAKVLDTLVVKEGRDRNHRSIPGMIRDRKSLLTQVAVAQHCEDPTQLDKFSEQQISEVNTVGIMTVHADRRGEPAHPLLVQLLLTLEYLNRVRKALVMGDEGPVLIQPSAYLLEPRFAHVRRIVDSFLSNEVNWARYKSAKFILNSDLQVPETADAFFRVICKERLVNLYEFLLVVAQESAADSSAISESIWMDKRPISP